MLAHQSFDFDSAFAYRWPDLPNLDEQTCPMFAGSGGVTFMDAIRCCASLTSNAKKCHNIGG